MEGGQTLDPVVTERRRLTRTVSVRVSDAEYESLARLAAASRMPVARLARVLLTFRLGELGRGNDELERAIKTSRDA